jgi:hypothetical protein
MRWLNKLWISSQWGSTICPTTLWHLGLIPHGRLSSLVLGCSPWIWCWIICTYGLAHDKPILGQTLHIQLVMCSSHNLLCTSLPFHLNLSKLLLQFHLLLLLRWKIMPCLRIVVWRYVGCILCGCWWLLAVCTLHHYVLVRIFPCEESCLSMSFSVVVVNYTLLWRRAFRFSKVHDILKITIL